METLPALELEIDVVELFSFNSNFKVSAKCFVWYCRMLVKMKNVKDAATKRFKNCIDK